MDSINCSREAVVLYLRHGKFRFMIRQRPRRGGYIMCERTGLLRCSARLWHFMAVGSDDGNVRHNIFTYLIYVWRIRYMYMWCWRRWWLYMDNDGGKRDFFLLLIDSFTMRYVLFGHYYNTIDYNRIFLIFPPFLYTHRCSVFLQAKINRHRDK